MMTIEQIKLLDRNSDPRKLLPTTIEFMKEMRREVNSGRTLRGEGVIPWADQDETRT